MLEKKVEVNFDEEDLKDFSVFVNEVLEEGKKDEK